MAMASKSVTEYERRRIENIKRNEQLLASLNIQSKLADLSASAKRHRVQAKFYKGSPLKKPRKSVVIRRSLRTQGKNPDSAGLKAKSPKKPTVTSPPKLRPISMRYSSTWPESDHVLVKKILNICKESPSVGCRVRAAIDLESMALAPEDVARVLTERITSVKFFPSPNTRMIAVGNKCGTLGFWNVDSENEDGDGIYTYNPHTAPLSAIVIHPFSRNKIITSCHDGLIRLLDIEKEAFYLPHITVYAIFSMAQRPDEVNSLYFGEGGGVLSIWDERSGKLSSSWTLHESRINTIDFNSENTNAMATSSSDGTACIWDLRKFGKSKPKPLKLVSHKRAVRSAFFSPSGSLLATTSLDDKIGVVSGANYEDEFMVEHYKQTGKWLSTFRGVWGWDDLYIFVGNTNRGVDVISAQEKKVVATLESPHMTSILCRFEPHPFKPGMFAGATGGGQVCIWNSSQI